MATLEFGSVFLPLVKKFLEAERVSPLRILASIGG
jgi:hypothetical protein